MRGGGGGCGAQPVGGGGGQEDGWGGRKEEDRKWGAGGELEREVEEGDSVKGGGDGEKDVPRAG